MIRALTIAFALIASACAATAGGYTQGDLAKLSFLEGRWQGIGPDGAPFYEPVLTSMATEPMLPTPPPLPPI